MNDLLSKLLLFMEINVHVQTVDAQLARFFWQNADRIDEYGIETVAKACFTSPATVSRFCKKLDFHGFSDFKVAFIEAWEENQQTEVRMSRAVYNQLHMQPELLVDYSFDLAIAGLQETKEQLNIADLEQAVRILGMAKTIHFIGIGYSHFVAKDAQHKFMRLGKYCTAYGNLEMQKAEFEIFREGEVAVILSFSGTTDATNELATLAKEQGLRVIAITADRKSELAQIAHHVITVSGRENQFTDSSTSGRILLHAMIDALYLLYGVVNNKNLVITNN
ncbi:MAG: MurR/RpiR family transcriptional regulator [Culicoidibacterales bacterium]